MDRDMDVTKVTTSLKSVPAVVGHVNDVVIQSTKSTGIDKDFYDFSSILVTSSNASDLFYFSTNCTDDLWSNCTDGNFTANATSSSVVDESFSDYVFTIITSIFLGSMILITIIGNVFVIAAILLERNLQNVANYLIVSLAVADLMVACLVMPLGAVYEISKGWVLGPEICDMWTSSDVLCCTASILHLVAIAVDRYWAVTNVDYIHTRTKQRIVIMIALVWSVAFIVSLAPQFGWKDDKYLDRINLEQRCMPSQDVGYQIFATFSTFYVPLFIILVLYWKIFQTARKRIHRRLEQRAPQPMSPHVAPSTISKNDKNTNNNGIRGKRRGFLKLKKSAIKKKSQTAEELMSALAVNEANTNINVIVSNPDVELRVTELTTKFTCENEDRNSSIRSRGTGSGNISPCRLSIASTVNEFQTPIKPEASKLLTAHCSIPHSSSTVTLERQVTHKKDRRETIEAKRERKAAKTLAIITGAFVMCWLPFFVLALVMPLCASCIISDYITSVFLWLGYFNSTLNPVIYTIFSPEFRQAFKRILCGVHYRNVKDFRSGKIR